MAVKNSLQTKAPQKLPFATYLSSDAVRERINAVIGGKDGQRFISAIISATTNNPALQECTNSSILSAALLGESLKLSPSPQLGYYYLVPFNDKKQGKVAQFQLGYKGYIQLAIRSNNYKKLNVVPVKEGELVSYDVFNEDINFKPIENEEEREKAPTIGYYAILEYTNGFRKWMYWSKQKMEAHALKYSKGYAAKKGYTFWEKDFDAMACKTMLRQLLSKWGIMSIEMITAFNNDMGVINENGTVTYVDNVDSEDVIDADGVVIEEVPNDNTSVSSALFNN